MILVISYFCKLSVGRIQTGNTDLTPPNLEKDCGEGAGWGFILDTSHIKVMIYKVE